MDRDPRAFPEPLAPEEDICSGGMTVTQKDSASPANLAELVATMRRISTTIAPRGALRTALGSCEQGADARLSKTTGVCAREM